MEREKPAEREKRAGQADGMFSAYLRGWGERPTRDRVRALEEEDNDNNGRYRFDDEGMGWWRGRDTQAGYEYVSTQNDADGC